MGRPLTRIASVAGCGEGLGALLAGVRTARRPAALPAGLGRGVALRGTIWPGGTADPFDGVAVVAADGTIARLAPAGALDLPADLPVLGGPGHWIGPGLVDAHVHLAFGAPDGMLRLGLVAVRDLGAPPERARGWRTLVRPPAGSPAVAVAGPLVTAPGGYPSASWGADGFARFVSSPESARQLVRDLVADGTDLIKLALEPGSGPVPRPAEVRAVVDAAHDAGLPVTVHALTAEMVTRALDAGADELSHVPTERLPEALVERIAESRIAVVSTLQTFFSEGRGAEAARNAAALFRAGVPLLYGTDLGNAGTRPGIDPRELDRLAATGLGRLGALRAATEGSARAAGLRGRTGRIAEHEPAAVVMLAGDPLFEPGLWHSPLLTIADGRMVTGFS
jgi:imidazolonepropionase-like amidohydrolase